MMAEKTIARFWVKVRKDGPIVRPELGPCWMWTASKNHRGYGFFTIAGRTVGAHRASYQMHSGSIPEGMFVLHKCDVPGCVNPAHLFLGTHTENMQDRSAKGRQPSGPQHWMRTRPERIARGERCGKATLTHAQVEEIRALSAVGVAQPAIGALFGVTRSAVSAIVTGRTWKS